MILYIHSTVYDATIEKPVVAIVQAEVEEKKLTYTAANSVFPHTKKAWKKDDLDILISEGFDIDRYEYLMVSTEAKPELYLRLLVEQRNADLRAVQEEYLKKIARMTDSRTTAENLLNAGSSSVVSITPQERANHARFTSIDYIP